MNPYPWSCAAAVLLLAAFAYPLRADPPKLTHLYPAGAARGQNVTVEAGGDFGDWPPKTWVDRSGVTFEPAEKKGRFAVQVADDATPGVYWLRVHNREGASSLRPFVVSPLPSVAEVEPNDHPDKPQVLDAAAVVVDGRLGKRGDVDGFAVDLLAGQTLVVSVLAHNVLASPMDAIVQVCDAAGNVLMQNDEGAGLDPHAVFVATSAGRHLVRVFAFPDTPTSSISFAGGDTFVYRLTVTTGPVIHHAAPMMLVAGDASPPALRGWNLGDGVNDVHVTPLDSHVERDIAVVWQARTANPLTLSVAPSDARAIFSESSDDASPAAKEPAVLDVGRPAERAACVTGVIATAGEEDTIAFHAAKGEKVAIEVDGRRLGAPLDPLIRIVDADGKVRAEHDDTDGRPDPSFVFAAPADGVYRMSVSDRFGHGGARYVYRVRLALAEPDYALRLDADHVEVKAGKSVEISVKVERRHGFAGDIRVVAEDLPAGVSAEPVVAKGAAKPEAKQTVKLKLATKGDDGAPAGAQVIRIVGIHEPSGNEKADDDTKDDTDAKASPVTKGQPLRREAAFELTNTGRLGYGVWLTVVGEAAKKQP